MPDLETTQYGFKWGPLEVARVMSLEDGRVVIQVSTPYKKIDVHSSLTGKSLRVFGAGEWKPVK